MTPEWKPLPSIPYSKGILMYNPKTDDLAVENAGTLVELSQDETQMIREKFKYQLAEVKACHPSE